ncbi:hypothetical protein ACFLTC_02870, partial [Chloroflexota bacterium]
PDISAKLMLLTLLFLMPAYYIAAQFRLEIFLYVRLSLVFVEIAVQVYFCRRIMGVSPFYLWHDGKSSVCAATVMAMGLGIAQWGMHSIKLALPQILTLALLVIVGGGIYVTTLWILDRAFVSQTASLLRQVVLA